MSRRPTHLARVTLACMILTLFGGGASLPSSAACGIKGTGVRGDAVYPGYPRGVAHPKSEVPKLPLVWIDVTGYSLKTAGAKATATLDVAGVPDVPLGSAGAAWIVQWSIGSKGYFAGLFKSAAGVSEARAGTYDAASQAYKADPAAVTATINKTTITLSWPAATGFPTKVLKATGAYSMNTAVAPWLAPVAAVLYHDAVPASSVAGAEKGPGGNVSC